MKILVLSQNLQFVKTVDLNERETTRAIRDAVVNEQLAVQQYEAIVDGTSNAKVKKVLQEIADEERVHIGELTALLKTILPDEEKHLEEGAKEVKEASTKLKKSAMYIEHYRQLVKKGNPTTLDQEFVQAYRQWSLGKISAEKVRDLYKKFPIEDRAEAV